MVQSLWRSRLPERPRGDHGAPGSTATRRHTGFPGVIGQIAQVIAGGRPTTIRPRLLITAGEVLAPLMRREISEACGAPFSTICTVQGRMLDYSSLANGRLCHPYELVMLILDHGTRWIGQYQLTQERRNHVVLVESVYDGIDGDRRCAALGSAAKRAQSMSARLHGTASRA